MELKGFPIESKKMLKENFLPFEKVWENVETGLYQECIRLFPGMDELTEELLDIADCYLSGSGQLKEKMRSQERYRNFVENNKKQMKTLEAMAKNEKQKGLLYLSVLMHIHAEYKSIAPETAGYISKLLREREVVVEEANRSGEPEIYRQRFAVIKKEACYLDDAGRIAALRTGRPIPMAEGLRNLRSFAYTEKLGLIVVDQNGQVRIKGGQYSVEVPSGVKIASVSAYLSNYILLGEDGTAYTNIVMDTSDWIGLRYAYVGLNSAAGIKKGNGSVVTAGIGNIENLANAARIHTYHDGEEKHYIVLSVNGGAKDDEGEVYRNVTAVTLDEDGYYYAEKDGTVYKRYYGENSSRYTKAKGRVKELLADQGVLFKWI